MRAGYAEAVDPMERDTEPAPGQARLRVIAVVEGARVPAAVARTIHLVRALPSVDLDFRLAAMPLGRRPRSRLADAVDRADRAVFRPAADAFRLVDLDDFPLELVVAPPDRVAAGSSPAADVLLDLTPAGSTRSASPPARLGTWSLRFGEERHRLGRAALARDFARGRSVAIAELVAHADVGPRAAGSPGPPGRVLYRSTGAMDRFSPARTRDAAAWKAAEFPARVLARITGGNPPPGDPITAERHSANPLRVRDVVRLAVVTGRRGLREATRRLAARPGWMVAVRTGGTVTSAGIPADLRGFHPLAAPAGRFYADPFVVRTANGAQLFVEDGPIAGGPARIATLELDASGHPTSAPRIVLERTTHLSYPFVFRDGTEWFLLPETAETRTVELFRARRFPDAWEPYAVLIEGIQAADPTLIRHGGRYWLFVTVTPPGGLPYDELSVYWSETLDGPWQAHRANPVVSDARHARPAGRILQRDGALLRPAQDCTLGYGRRIVLNRIEILSEEAYREVPVGTIEPRGLAGVRRTHTYTADDGIEALDGFRYEPRWGRSRRRLASAGPEGPAFTWTRR